MSNSINLGAATSRGLKLSTGNLNAISLGEVRSRVFKPKTKLLLSP